MTLFQRISCEITSNKSLSLQFNACFPETDVFEDTKPHLACFSQTHPWFPPCPACWWQRRGDEPGKLSPSCSTETEVLSSHSRFVQGWRCWPRFPAQFRSSSDVCPSFGQLTVLVQHVNHLRGHPYRDYSSRRGMPLSLQTCASRVRSLAQENKATTWWLITRVSFAVMSCEGHLLSVPPLTRWNVIEDDTCDVRQAFFFFFFAKRLQIILRSENTEAKWQLLSLNETFIKKLDWW